MNGRPSVHGQVASCVISRLWLRIAFEGTDLLIFVAGILLHAATIAAVAAT